MNKIKKTSENASKQFKECESLFQKKLESYGTKDLNKIEQVVMRMKEKISRIENLLDYSNNKSDDESIKDTLLDISGYGIIGRLIEMGLWGEDKEYQGDDEMLTVKHGQDGGILSPQKDGDCGLDLIVGEDVVIRPNNGKPIDIACNISMKVPDGYFALILNRSSTSRKLGLWVVPGVIDNGYTGKIYTCVYNMNSTDVEIKKGMRLAQCIFLPIFVPKIIEVEKLPETVRGGTGFGSTN